MKAGTFSGEAESARAEGASLNKIQIKRIYEPPARSDGMRILVDRLWPRGVARDGARIEWPEFRARYIVELKNNPAVIELHDMAAKSKAVTLLFAAKDNLGNNAAVLHEFLSGGTAAK